MEILIRKPLEYEEEAYIHLSCELSEFNRSYHPNQKDDLEGVIEARSERACRIFQDNDEKQIILMGVLNDEPVGYALARIFTPELTSDDGTELTGLLEEIYVMKKARGLGIGEKLISGIEEWVKENGADRLRIQIYEWNEIVKRLSKGKGFIPYALSYKKSYKIILREGHN